MSELFTPLTLRCGVTVANRVALAPLTNTQSGLDGVLSAEEHRWLLRRARGGFGWVSTCATYVCEEGKAWAGQLGIANDEQGDALAPLARELREAGAAAFVQLHHAGAKAELAPEQRLSTVDDDANGIRGASAADLQRVTDAFVAAALRAEHAGFSGVEIHGANGYLFTQFLAPADNPRRDAFGGTLARRAKHLRRTVAAVRGAVSPNFAVGVRISPVDVWAKRGLLLRDSTQLGEWLAADGVDFIHLSLSNAVGSPPHEDSSTIVTTALRKAIPGDVALLAAGGVWTPADAHAVLDAGADLVALGKAAIGNPDWPSHAADLDWQPVRPPWSEPYLASVDVSPRFVEYLRRWRTLVS